MSGSTLVLFRFDPGPAPEVPGPRAKVNGRRRSRARDVADRILNRAAARARIWTGRARASRAVLPRTRDSGRDASANALAPYRSDRVAARLHYRRQHGQSL